MGDLEILKTVALEISTGREESDLHHTIVSSSVDLIDCDAGGIALFDEERQSVLIPLAFNLPGYLNGLSFKLGAGIFSQVIQTRKAQRIDDYLAEANKIEELANAGIRAMAQFPLVTRGKVIGTLWVCMLKPGRVFSDYDMTLLESISGQAAVAIDNIRLFEEERYISDTLQRGFLPERLPELKHTDIGTFYASATIAAVVGGDFYDLIRISDEQIGISLGDISGKGVEATTDAAMVKYSLRAVTCRKPGPSGVLTTANNIVTNQLTGGHFVTLVYGLYNLTSGQLTLGIAGHPYPLLYTAANKEVAQIEGGDPAFGLILDYNYSETEFKLSSGDALVLYSDGIIELRRDKEFFGVERLSKLVAKHSRLSAQGMANKIIDEARKFAEGRLTDDIVLMVIKRTD